MVCVIEKADNISLRTAIDALSSGQVVAVPTETVYGLVGDASHPAAFEAIYTLKQRPAHMPLQLLVASFDEARRYGIFDDMASALGKAFWPGSLTIVVRANNQLPFVRGVVTPQETIGIRVPNHALIQRLLKEYGRPLMATSANISGQPTLAHAEDIRRTFGDGVSAVIEGDISVQGVASTVVDVTGDEWRILRDGAIPEKDIMRVYRESIG